MILGGVLDRANHQETNSIRFTIKGGVALELRLRDKARATADMDVMTTGPTQAERLAKFEEALAATYEEFTFRRKGDPYVMASDTIRLSVALSYGGVPWATVLVDLSPSEGENTEVDLIDAVPLAALSLNGPEQLPCLSLRYQIAQKIHALTGSRPGDRYRDLVDLQLLAPLVTNQRALTTACRDLFALRGKHSWPPSFTPPTDWEAPFARLASDIGVPHAELSTATAWLNEFLQSIEHAGSPPRR